MAWGLAIRQEHLVMTGSLKGKGTSLKGRTAGGSVGLLGEGQLMLEVSEPCGYVGMTPTPHHCLHDRNLYSMPHFNVGGT